MVVPERVRAYVLVAQRGLARCLQELHTQPPKQPSKLGPKQEQEQRKGNEQWQPIVIVEALQKTTILERFHVK